MCTKCLLVVNVRSRWNNFVLGVDGVLWCKGVLSNLDGVMKENKILYNSSAHHTTTATAMPMTEYVPGGVRENQPEKKHPGDFSRFLCSNPELFWAGGGAFTCRGGNTNGLSVSRLEGYFFVSSDVRRKCRMWKSSKLVWGKGVSSEPTSAGAHRATKEADKSKGPNEKGTA